MQNFVLKKLVAGNKVGKVGNMAQIKISLVLIYYIGTGVMGLVTFTYYGARNTMSELRSYLICKGLNGSDCPVEPESINIFHYLSTIVVAMFSLLPVVMLAFSINWQAFVVKSRKWLKQLKAKQLIQQE